MGLFDSVVGALGSAASGGNGGQPDLMGLVAGLLGQGQGGLGGLAGLVAKFQQGGLGEVVASWVSTGQNLPISPAQLGSVLGNDAVAGLAQKAGLDQGALLGQLSQLLPQVVDKLTPDGQLPQGGGMGDLAGMLGGLSGLLKG
ncbi:conserved hypothetical protein [Rubrivivax sp. A210]|uniref:YidB family protein n=1 Tax=Rubrivivax sp. A210 TaxID=2772301 RepID=UPI001917BB16|nr:YidB family protein [Rubrivivax sp. A210]CAD5373226.1 conserved hypothetical protein [Rubrivivax sp. A210]